MSTATTTTYLQQDLFVVFKDTNRRPFPVFIATSDHALGLDVQDEAGTPSVSGLSERTGFLYLTPSETISL